MPTVAKSDQSTGNGIFASYVLKSNDLTFVLTAPYSRTVDKTNSRPALPWYKQDEAYAFLNKHGLAVRSVGRCCRRKTHCWQALVQLKEDCSIAGRCCQGLVTQCASHSTGMLDARKPPDSPRIS